jgi:hypothetical protein
LIHARLRTSLNYQGFLTTKYTKYSKKNGFFVGYIIIDANGISLLASDPQGRAIVNKFKMHFATKRPIPPAPFMLKNSGKGEKNFSCGVFAPLTRGKNTAFSGSPPVGRG